MNANTRVRRHAGNARACLHRPAPEAQSRQRSAHASRTAWPRHALAVATWLGLFILSGTSAAAPADCAGVAPDGQKKCTAPLISGYTYNLCSSSDLFVAYALQDRCYASVVGGYGIPIKQEGTLQALISCMGGQAPLTWQLSGSGNGHWCGGSVSYKYGQQVTGVSLEIPYGYGNLQARRFKQSVCPHGYTAVGPNTNLPDYCVLTPKTTCDVTSNPMGIANGDHNLVERDIARSAGSPLEFTRYYSSTAYYRPVNAPNPQTFLFGAILELNLDWNLSPGFGDYWRHTYERKIVLEGAPHLLATALRHNGVNKHFRLDGTSVFNEDGRSDKLTATRDAQGAIVGWVYTSGDEVEQYSVNGELLSITTRAGRRLQMIYGAHGRLAEVQDDTGRALRFGYDTMHRLTSVTDSANRVIGYSYSGVFMLSGVTYPDGASKAYLYNESPEPNTNGGEYGLTGVIDESANRFATYGYANGSARAYAEHAGTVERVQRTVVSGTQVALTDALGSNRVYTIQSICGVSRVTSQSQPAGSGCLASASNLSYDANGNVASRDDFNGHRTCYANDLSRNVETTRVEGLASTASCSPLTAAGASLPAGSRKTSTQWHPDWRLATKVAEPQRLTSYVYNGRPDPFAGNAIASCAPAGAVLPDGKPIAVLCKKVVQATTDSTGALGFGAALQSGVPNDTEQWTYNGRGQVLTAQDALGATTTYAYYTSTSADYSLGDLQSLTDRLGRVTSYPKYDALGHLLRQVDPNGHISDVAYDARQRPVSLSGGGRTTSYAWQPTGLLERATQADGSFVEFGYDAAQRLVRVTDRDGNRIDYTLDAAGQRTGEAVNDAGGALKRQLARVLDALSRLQQVNGRE